MPLESIDSDIARLAELCRPGVLECAWHTASYRVMVRDIARNPVSDGAHIEYSDDQIRAEFRALLAECPELPVCPNHTEELVAVLVSGPAVPG